MLKMFSFHLTCFLRLMMNLKKVIKHLLLMLLLLLLVFWGKEEWLSGLCMFALTSTQTPCLKSNLA